jgi:hypothetical protein
MSPLQTWGGDGGRLVQYLKNGLFNTYFPAIKQIHSVRTISGKWHSGRQQKGLSTDLIKISPKQMDKTNE